MRTYEELEKFVYNKLDDKKKGNRVLPKAVIQAIYKAQPTTVNDLMNIKGFPKDGERFNNYAHKIVNFLKTTSVFS